MEVSGYQQHSPKNIKTAMAVSHMRITSNQSCPRDRVLNTNLLKRGAGSVHIIAACSVHVHERVGNVDAPKEAMPEGERVGHGATGERIHGLAGLKYAGEGELVGADVRKHVAEGGPGIGGAVAGGVAADHGGPSHHVSVRHFVEQDAGVIDEARLQV